MILHYAHLCTIFPENKKANLTFAVNAILNLSTVLENAECFFHVCLPNSLCILELQNISNLKVAVLLFFNLFSLPTKTAPQ